MAQVHKSVLAVLLVLFMVKRVVVGTSLVRPPFCLVISRKACFLVCFAFWGFIPTTTGLGPRFRFAHCLSLLHACRRVGRSR